MRKHVLIISLLIFCSSAAFSQTKSQELQQQAIRKEIDSLKRILPTLKDRARVDGLNTLAYKYFALHLNWKQLVDSSWPYAEEANKLAKNINYKKALGYSYLRMGVLEARKYGFDAQVNNKRDTLLLSSIDKNIRQVISIGQDLDDNLMLGGAYRVLAYLVREKGDLIQFADHLEKSRLYYEKPIILKAQPVYGSYEYINCTQCEEYQTGLGRLAMEIGYAYVSIKRFEKAEESINRAIEYFKKVKAIWELGNAYSWLKVTHFRRGNLLAGIEALKRAVDFFHEAGDDESENATCMMLAGSLIQRGDFETGFEYCKRNIKLSEKIALGNPSRSAEGYRGRSFTFVGDLYKTAGDYETALYYIKKARDYFPKDSIHIAEWSSAIGDVYRLMGNYDSASYYLSTFSSRSQKQVPGGVRNLCELYIDTKQYDKAVPFLNRLTDKSQGPTQGGASLSSLGLSLTVAANICLKKGNYEVALEYARDGLAQMKLGDQRLSMIDNYQLHSEIFHALGRNDSAYYYQNRFHQLKDSIVNRKFLWRLSNYKKEAEEERKTSQIKLLEKDNLIKEQQLQQQVFLQEQSEAQVLLLDKDNKIKDQQLQIKEQELNSQVLLKEQKQSQVSLLDNENKLKSQQLKQQAFVRNALVAGLILFLLLGLLFTRNLLLKRKNEKLRMQKDLEVHQLESAKKQAELHQKAIELEMQALRAQMNPHFIFNCLSSINRFIFKNDNKVASDYLTRFSRLIRMVLMHSQKKLIPLEDELEMIRLYLDLERLRFKDAFDYSITTTNIVDAGTIFIPPLLLQPFCENAVWHGLMHKESKGHLNVTISEVVTENDKTLHCIIEDNGVGREKAAEMKSKSAGKEKSLGLKITTERIALLNKENNFNTFYKIDDILNDEYKVAGTRVQLKIKYKEAMEEIV